MENYIEEKWTNGTQNIKSERIKKFVHDVENCDGLSSNINNDFISIEEEYQMNNIPNINTNMNDEIFKQKSKKREEQNLKLSSRHMIIQKNVNPFLNNNDYIKHIDMEDEFLRPKDSNIEKID